MIEMKHICFSYGKTDVLKDIDLCLEPGKLYAVIGPNGSGKSTLIRLLSRLVQPQKGALSIDGKAYKSYKRKEFAQQVAMLPQGRNTPNITAQELVGCGRFPWLGLSRKLSEKDYAIVQSSLALTATAAFARRNVKQLSGGERQRVYLAMLYAQQTPYVFLDEPNTYLDIAGSLEIMDQLIMMKQAGKCVAAVLHDLAMALKYADRIILMDRGSVRLCASPEEVVESGLLQEVFHVICTPVKRNEITEYLFNKA